MRELNFFNDLEKIANFTVRTSKKKWLVICYKFIYRLIIEC